MGRGSILLAFWLTLLFAIPIWSLLRGHPSALGPTVLTDMLGVEIDATRQQLELYKHKVELIAEALDQAKQRLANRIGLQSTTGHAASGNKHLSMTKLEHRKQYLGTTQLFRDWFTPQSTFATLGSLAQLISFRPQVSPLSKRQQTPPRHKSASTATEDGMTLQFLLVLDPRSTVMSLFHPTTHEVMWQHALNLHSFEGNNSFEIADVFFASERSAHLTLLSKSGKLVSFKLRLWYNRRVISGDSRRLIPLRNLDDPHLRCVAGQDAAALTAETFQPPWLHQSTSRLTAPPPGKYIHIDIERAFEVTLNGEWCYARGKVAVVTSYQRAFVITSDTSGGHVSVFNGDMGDFIADLHTRSDASTPHNDGVVQLRPLQSGRGMVAVATRSRVFFVDPNEPFLIPVACEAPERHGFTSLAVDPLRPYFVYTGTSTGRAFVYKLHHFRSWQQHTDFNEQEARIPAMCTLVDQLLPRRSQLPALNHELPVMVQTLPGFLLLGVDTRLTLYQLPASETARPIYLSEQSLSGPYVDPFDSRRLRVLEISATKLQFVHRVSFAVLVHQESSSVNSTGLVHLEIYESRIPPPGASLDLSWVRIPVMMVCALTAMFWQRKGRRSHSGGGGSDFDEAELIKMLRGRGVRKPDRQIAPTSIRM